MKPRPPWGCFPLLAGAVLFNGATDLRAAGAEVTASIHIPPAEVYVLGDDIPLVWRFTNQSPEPLAMLWEGCCRLNGKLAISANGRSVDVLPPGASSYHTYSKAETLPPGKPTQFSSLLADWVRLPAGGELEIGGRYTGVLTSQKPQVPSGLALWTGTASAEPTRLAVLGVNEYLEQRPARAGERGLELALTGPDQLPPLKPATFRVTLRNLREQPQVIDWPGTFQLWLVNERGWRLDKGLRHLQSPGEHLTIPARGELHREFQLSSADLNGEAFGLLTVFLDLGPSTPQEKRVPSSAVRVSWNLNPADTAALLSQAASGPAAGLRNPALKLLRQHLGALESNLALLSDSQLESDRARSLRDELRLAGCVLPWSPKAGSVFLPLAHQPDNRWTLAFPDRLCEALAGLEGSAQMGRVAAVRRHLGWDVTPEISPQPATTLGEVFSLARSLSAHQEQLAGPLTWRLPQTDRAATNLVQFPLAFPSANVLIRFTRVNGRLEVHAAQKPMVPGRPAWMNQLTAAEAKDLAGVPLSDPAAIKEWLESAPPALQPLVVVEEAIACGDLREWLQPLVDASLRMSVIPPAALP